MMTALRHLSCVIAGLALLSTAAWAEMFGPIAGTVYRNGGAKLVLIVHGDSGAGYISDFAADVARANPTATVIQMARPGYILNGERSKGSNSGLRDHHTRTNNKLLAEGFSAASQKYPHDELIAVGHSGGGNQIGSIVGTDPSLIDTAIMFSVPYDIQRWRNLRGSPWPKSQSPVRYLKSVSPNTKLIAATGSEDSNTLPTFAKDYVKKAKAKGLNATYIELPGGNHGFRTIQDQALELVNREIRN
ncbi:alpha/beta hydrolase family protein [Phaeobacter marinintestinus]|uniref:alpha/beta hydrolase family protein n=1 Tax=Falsiphaeobacter marinintestinus TaxID=1492905 RepID=UPI0011B47B8E|nr:prolyl oligopeptidase family serine peptidase [Phaeobacter marinintestinus]